MNGKKSSTFPTVNGRLTSQITKLDALLGGNVDKSDNDASWSLVDPTVVHSIVWAVTHLGGTAQFGITKNCRAYVIKLYIGKLYDPLYYDGNDDGVAQIQALAQALVEMAASGT